MNIRKTFNGATLDKDLTLDADVVIVGTGAGGGYTAEVLSNAGLRVVMLEKGGYNTAKTFSQNEGEAFPMLYMDNGAQRTKDKGFVVLQGRSVGGGTTVNWTTSFRTPERTLKHWVDAYGVKGYAPEAMAPHFDAVEKRLNIATWEMLPPNANNAMVAKGCEKLGYEWHLTKRNVNGCANSGLCGLGCPINAKQGMVVTTIPSALDKGAVLVSCAEAIQIVHDGKRAAAVEALAMDKFGNTPTGRRIRVNAKHLVVSAGAIRSPALLLRSKVPDPSGLTGKRTFLHPVALSVAKMPEAVNGFHGAPQSVYSDHFWLPEGKLFGAARLGYKVESAPVFPVFVAALFDKSFGSASADLMTKLPFLQCAIALHRDGYNQHEKCGTVEVSGDIGVTLDYAIDDFLTNSLVQSLLEVIEIQFAAGAEFVIPMHIEGRPLKSLAEAKVWAKDTPMGLLRLLAGAAHVMGGCQMGADAKTSVVDEWGRHRAIENLSVIDASVFPTSVGANPQESIYATAAKNGTALAKALA
jgi:choline dehydrogenase-like flavoprotein